MLAAALSLRIYEADGRCVIDVNVGGRSINKILGQSWDNVHAARTVLAKNLIAARKTLGYPGGKVQIEEAHDFLNLLNRSGMDALQRVLGRDQTYELVAHFRDAIPDLREDIRDKTGFPIVEIEQEGAFLQFEVLPLAGLDRIPPFRELDNLMQAASRFAGFAFVTRRTGRAMIQPDHRLQSSPRVPMKMFRNAGYAGSSAEADHLNRNFALDGGGAWPDVAGHSIEAAVRAIVHCDKDFAGSAKKPVDQIHHFSCHSAPSDEGSYLEFRAAEDDPSPIRIVPADFNVEFMLERPITPYARPFAFLNACETNCQTVDGFADWTTTLVESGYRTVVGTEAPIPDVFGSEFSQAFYGELAARRSIGEALQRAKWTLLRQWKNPLGLLYTLCGNPELQIDDGGLS